MIYYKKKIQQDVGATAIEYGILSALIAVVTILGLQATGTNLGTTYCNIANKLSQAVGAGSTASGCSANSGGSGSSGNGGTNAEESGSPSPAPASTQPTYTASNSYTVSDPETKYENLEGLLLNKISAMSGFYDANGNEIKTPEEYAESIGIKPETYQKIANAWVGNPPEDDPSAPELTTLLDGAVGDEMKAEIAAAGKTFYMPNLDNVTFTQQGGATSKSDGTIGNDPNDHNWRYEGINLYQQELNPPTGN